MISSIFERTNPLNFIILFLYLILFLLLRQVLSSDFVLDSTMIFHLLKCSAVVFFCVIMVDFIVRKNELTQRNSYALFFFVLLFCLFPNIFMELNVLLAHFFLLLAFRRLVSIRSNKDVEIKIFDATLWILVATYFFNWSLLFIFLVFCTMFLYKKNDYRNMLIPFVALFTLAILGFTYFYLTDQLSQMTQLFNFQVDFIFEKYSNLSYLVPLLFLLIMGGWACVMFAFKKQSKSFKTRVPGILLVISLITAVAVILISEVTNTSEVLFMLFPLAVIQARYVERVKINWLKETILWSYICMPILVLFL
ncbi:DUF6427 family protein [Galbibacter sp.]|jgi:hypothetical protein|uniref:DUF6427 family protein n=1 Tax=Galbibacter sp. TaxID=2918471 RepID=UPI003A8FA22E